MRFPLHCKTVDGWFQSLMQYIFSYQCEGKLKEARMYATNRNQLGSKTVIALKFITEDTRKPFVIPGIVDRIAVMLNYVLKQLVGEESRNLKVSIYYVHRNE